MYFLGLVNFHRCDRIEAQGIAALAPRFDSPMEAVNHAGLYLNSRYSAQEVANACRGLRLDLRLLPGQPRYTNRSRYPGQLSCDQSYKQPAPLLRVVQPTCRRPRIRDIRGQIRVASTREIAAALWQSQANRMHGLSVALSAPTSQPQSFLVCRVLRPGIQQDAQDAPAMAGMDRTMQTGRLCHRGASGACRMASGAARHIVNAGAAVREIGGVLCGV